jgi:heme/copper-type cytochrome/quinol oxidase subunit 2
VKGATWLWSGDQVHSEPEIESGIEEGVPTLLHWLVALALTLFLVYQVPTLAFILKAHRAHAAAKGRNRRSAALLWIAIPVLVVVVLAARSWVAVLDVDRPAVASSATALTSGSSGRSIPSAP